MMNATTLRRRAVGGAHYGVSEAVHALADGGDQRIALADIGLHAGRGVSMLCRCEEGCRAVQMWRAGRGAGEERSGCSCMGRTRMSMPMRLLRSKGQPYTCTHADR